MNDRYSKVAKTLHWSMAILIIMQLAMGLTFMFVENLHNKGQLIGLHKQGGALILALVILRIIWRLTHKYPNLDFISSKIEPPLARIGQILLYILMLAIPIIGILYSQSGGYTVHLFNWQLPNLTQIQPKELRELYLLWHRWLAVALLVLIVIHVAIALKHHFINKDRLLSRMLPWGK